MTKGFLAIIVSLLVSIPAGAQIMGPRSVAFGDMVVVPSKETGDQQWEISDPEGLKFILTLEGGIAFASGCSPATITVRCYVIDWDSQNFSIDKTTVVVGKNPNPDPLPVPPPPLNGAAKIACDAFAESSPALKACLVTVAKEMETIASRGAALSDWDSHRVIREVNEKATAAFKDANVFEEADEIYPRMLAAATLDSGASTDNKAEAVQLFLDIATGLGAVR